MARILAILAFLTAPAFAQEGHIGHGHDTWHQNFYQKLVTPDTKVSCCNLADCRPTSLKQEGANYSVKVDGAWVVVPQNKIVKVSAPDGGAHVCAPVNFSGQPEHLYCVVLPPEG